MPHGATGRRDALRCGGRREHLHRGPSSWAKLSFFERRSFAAGGITLPTALARCAVDTSEDDGGDEVSSADAIKASAITTGTFKLYGQPHATPNASYDVHTSLTLSSQGGRSKIYKGERRVAGKTREITIADHRTRMSPISSGQQTGSDADESRALASWAKAAGAPLTSAGFVDYTEPRTVCMACSCPRGDVAVAFPEDAMSASKLENLGWTRFEN